MYRILVVTIFLLLACPAFAAPQIANVNGTFSEGQTVTLGGLDFGTQGPDIISWDNFESHSLGSRVHQSSALIGPNWTTQATNDPAVTYSGTHSHSGAVAAHVDWSGGGNIHAFGWAGQGPISSIYISYWRYMQGDYSSNKAECITNDGYNCNHKQFYLFGNISNTPQGMPLIPAGTTVWGFYNNVSADQGGWNENNNINTKGWTYFNTIGQMQRWSFWAKLNEPWDCEQNVNCNGELSYWLDGSLGKQKTDYRHRFVNGTYNDFRLGHMASGFESTAKAWFDDLYIARTPARVELCSVGDWPMIEASGAHCEVQIVSNWTSSQVQLQFNQGTFANGEQAYLFVIDANGAVSESTQIQVGASGTNDALPPSAPSNLRDIRNN